MNSLAAGQGVVRGGCLRLSGVMRGIVASSKPRQPRRTRGATREQHSSGASVDRAPLVVRSLFPRPTLCVSDLRSYVISSCSPSCWRCTSCRTRWQSLVRVNRPCSMRMPPTKRMTAAGFVMMPATFERRLISLLRRSSGFVLCSWRWCSIGRCRLQLCPLVPSLECKASLKRFELARRAVEGLRVPIADEE